ncbi:intersectin-1 isoform X2 [Agrilus planipennis]|uniref:Intersectin-1 isoform X2 n=1 Tax=Agrilus planipennis TaxID=224129 RepID=A0A7F5RAT1_AGRPL|nr:intersectin-1 isoform X2 [Agrilus planipennis]
MMSAAGTPSSDPWVIVARERARYEEQFKSLKPANGIITGEQAKEFFLKSQLPPLVLGQIWALADTDSDGKMDINEFSIACKLINLTLRGFEVPKVLPPTLVASLQMYKAPPIPPLPSVAQQQKIPTLLNQLPSVPSSIPSQTLLSNLTSTTNIPTGIVNPMQNTLPNIQPSMVPTLISQPVVPLMGQQVKPVIPVIPPVANIPMATAQTSTAPLPAAGIIQGSAPLISGSTVTSIPLSVGPPPIPSMPIMSTTLPNATAFATSAPVVPVMPTVSSAPLIHSALPSTTSTPLIPGISNSTTAVATVSAVAPPSGGPSATSTPRASIGSVDRNASLESPQIEWAVPHHIKLKYTQMFNTADRSRSGYLSGAQARNVMMQTKLPQNILAQVWALSDMDSDGRLGCEEFVLAMHLCEQAQQGIQPPTELPPDLIPPSFRKGPRTNSVSSQGSAQPEQDPASTLLTSSFEDKRKENFEKGQAELERRRKTLLEQQRKEAEERERKEREEIEKREKARLEAERKRMEELEKQMREQQEQERLKEEERKRQNEQREAARREMERQRQLEWEKQRLQELQQQRQREQETVLKMKAKNQSLTIELSSLNDHVKELSQKICDTRVGVSNVKSTIDGMRSTRDAQMQEMSQLKNKLKEQNAKLLALSQEKAKLDAKNKLNLQMGSEQQSAADRQAFENKEITIKHLREKIDDMQKQIETKMSDIENNNTQLSELRSQLNQLVNDCENLYSVYENKRDKVLEMKNVRNTDSTWKEGGWGDTGTEWPVNKWESTPSETDTETTLTVPVCKYRALYEFVARNMDEISFQPGDIVNVPYEQTGEPGWLAGELRGNTGWFPESYVEPLDGIGVRAAFPSSTETPTAVQQPEVESKRLEEIEEVPEVVEVSSTFSQFIEETTVTPAPTSDIPPPAESLPEGPIEYCIANFPYQSIEQGDLSFNAGDIITVVKKEGDWWTGKLGDVVGIFPSNYVQKYDPNANNNKDVVTAAPTNVAASTPPSFGTQQENTSSQMDNEVSQINENKPSEKINETSTTPALKGSKKPEIASVIAPYQATSPEQLSLARGQLIMVRKKTDSGWWEGELQAKGKRRQVGWFPASYVKILNSSGRMSGRTTPVSTTRMQQEVVIDKVIALFPYTAANPDELSFLKDDIISITAREEPSWWRGELNGVSGLFPSNYVAPLTQSNDPQEKVRRDAINELIQTEKAYINDMATVHEVFELPLKQSKIITNEEVNIIFVNWQDILECNRNFLKELLERWESDSNIIGDIICTHLPRMTAYITFCSKQLESATLLQKLTETSASFRDVVKRCQSHRSTKGMPLSSFLIKPMQRITRYPLLISKIIENTHETHPDYKYLIEAQRVADVFLKRLNENVRLRENEERLEWLQNNVQLGNDLKIVFNSITNKLGPRKLIHHGVLTKVKSGKELVGILFNDFFMLIQPSKAIGSSQFNFSKSGNIVYKIYRQPILIQDLKVVKCNTDSLENGTDSNRALRIHYDNQIISLLATSVNECNLWVKKIESTKEVYDKVVSLSRSRPKSKPQTGATCGRLLVLVQKGTRFISSGKPHTENIYCKVILGDQEQQTNAVSDSIIGSNTSLNGAPQIPTLVWDYSMQFHVKNINEEILTLIVYETSAFQPDEFLGRAELKISSIYKEQQNTNGPLIKRLILHQVESGEITIKLDLQLFSNNY